MVNGVIFDMDGLMFDTERIWDGCWEPVCNRMGVSYKKRFVRSCPRHIWRNTSPHSPFFLWGKL